MSERPSRQHLICLVRHGEAKSELEDPQGSLTALGRRTVEQMAAWAFAAGLRMDEIWHSGKARAAETAAIFARRFQPPPSLVLVPGLEPYGNVVSVADRLRGEARTVMLVAHLPFLSRLASLLVVGSADCEIVQFEPSSLVVLRGADATWVVACHLQPEFLA